MNFFPHSKEGKDLCRFIPVVGISKPAKDCCVDKYSLAKIHWKYHSTYPKLLWVHKAEMILYSHRKQNGRRCLCGCSRHFHSQVCMHEVLKKSGVWDKPYLKCFSWQIRSSKESYCWSIRQENSQRLFTRPRIVKAMANYLLHFFSVLQSYIIASLRCALTFEHYIIRLLLPPQQGLLCIWPSLPTLGDQRALLSLLKLATSRFP